MLSFVDLCSAVAELSASGMMSWSRPVLNIVYPAAQLSGWLWALWSFHASSSGRLLHRQGGSVLFHQ